ncbi:hypothetical protein CN586_12370 [Bacillus toyonensis]|uniref:hypothetical protein n=1 Tax=Bacillus toyonensis TaxID=155322 RepID=UPI000BF2449F|nr:hypothetical protein [Bacillus toyonensis]PEK47416.1 hypothetical protein CN586_12370 [Bacillus toyonensis]
MSTEMLKAKLDHHVNTNPPTKAIVLRLANYNDLLETYPKDFDVNVEKKELYFKGHVIYFNEKVKDGDFGTMNIQKD